MTILRDDDAPPHHKKSSSPAARSANCGRAKSVRHAIAEILLNGSVHDSELEGHIISVPEVRMSPDLKLATIYVMRSAAAIPTR